MVEARGVVIATLLAALLVLGLVAYGAFTLLPSTLRQQACQSGQLPDSECD